MKAHILIQRWFSSGEGWAYDSDFPPEERSVIMEKMSRVVRGYSKKNIEEEDEYKNWMRYIFVIPDTKCLDPKAQSRYPHIDICVLIPFDWQTPRLTAEKLCDEALKKNEVGPFECKQCEKETNNFEQCEKETNIFPTKKTCIIGAGVFVVVVLACLFVTKHWGGGVPNDNDTNIGCPVVDVAPPVPPGPNVGPDSNPPNPEPKVLPPEDEDPLVKLLYKDEERIVKEWRKEYFRNLESFIEKVNEGVEMRSNALEWTEKGNGHPDLHFIVQRFPEKRLPSLKGVKESEYPAKIKEMCEVLGITSFEQIDKNRFEYSDFFKSYTLKPGDIVEPVPHSIRTFVQKFAGDFSSSQERIASSLVSVLPNDWWDEEDCVHRPYLLVWYVLYKMDSSQSPGDTYKLLEENSDSRSLVKKFQPEWDFEETKDFDIEFQAIWKIWERKGLFQKKSEVQE